MLLINVLPTKYYNNCHIASSISVPLDTMEELAKNIDKETPIVVYCASYMCSASKEGYKILRELGFTQVRLYEGGMAEWLQLGYSCIGECKEQYLQRKEQPTATDIPQVQAQELNAMLKIEKE